MNELTAALKEELNVDTAFTLPIFGGIDIPESIAVSWGIMAFLVIVSILLTRNLKVNHISKRQAILETAVVTMDNFFKDLLGEAGKQYVPYLITVALYIACSNLIGIIGLKPPTKDLNVTAALAIMSIVLIEYSGIHAKGGKRFVHSLAEPIALMTPMNILEIAIRPTSLCMRLFGNVLGAFVIMELIKGRVPVKQSAAGAPPASRHRRSGQCSHPYPSAAAGNIWFRTCWCKKSARPPWHNGNRGIRGRESPHPAKTVHPD